MSAPSVRYERHGHVGVVTLARPDRRNAIGHVAARELDDAWRQFGADADAWVGVLLGSGSDFCTGRDIRDDMSALPHGDLDDLFVPRTDRPIIAGVQGRAFGLGWYMAAGCDYVVAGEDAQFAMPQLKAGLPGPYAFAPRLNLTPQQSFEILCLGRSVSAARALELGVVNEIVPAHHVTDQALAVADELLTLPPQLCRLTKQLLRESATPPSDAVRALYDEARVRLEAHPDTAEARAALREKRPPRYVG